MTLPPGPLIDIHCHILPGIDDGARYRGESLAMASIAARDGIAAVIATPHHLPRSSLTAVEEARRRVAALQRAVDLSGTGLRLHAGQEIAAGPDLPRLLLEHEAVPLNGTRYVLVEPPFGPYPPSLDEVLAEVQRQGMVPILAHPERCAGIQEAPEVLAGLVGRGVLAQANTGSLLGHHGDAARRTVELLLGRGLVHVLATDAHAATGRRVPVMTEGVQAAARIVGEERAWAMVTTVPLAILEGRPLPAPRPAAPASRRSEAAPGVVPPW